LKIKRDIHEEESYLLSQKESSIHNKSRRISSKKTEKEAKIDIIDEKYIEDSPQSKKKEGVRASHQSNLKNKVNVYYENRQQSIDMD
jgi:hypothetical protein